MDKPEETSSASPDQDAQTPQPMQVKVGMGMDWETGMVLVQASATPIDDKDAKPVITTIQIPAQSFVEAGVSIGMQMLQRINAEAGKSKSGILLAHPGQVPDDLRRRH